MEVNKTEYILQMNDIVKTFPGVKALDHVNLKVRPGSVHDRGDLYLAAQQNCAG